MKIRAIVMFLMMLPLFSFAQRDSNTVFILNEYGIAVNYFQLNQDYSHGNAGYGVFAYHSGAKNKLINFVFGVEYNRVSFYQDYIYAGHFANYSDANISCNSLTFPLLIRAGFGDKIRFFVETGARIDFRIWSSLHALYNTSYPINNQQVYHTEEVNQSAKIAGDHPLDFIPSFGIGMSYKIKKMELILRTDYRMGLIYFYNYNSNSDFNNSKYFNFSVSLRINNQK